MGNNKMGNMINDLQQAEEKKNESPIGLYMHITAKQ